MGIKILGTGSALPTRVVTNHDLSLILDTSDEWIRTRTGIRTRHILGEGESLVSLAADATRAALDMAAHTVSAEEIDLLVCCTVGGDYTSPAMACLVQAAVGLGEHTVTLDINMGCCGFLYGLQAAEAYLAAGMAQNAVVLAAEGLSRHADWTDRSTACLFGDAAAAVVVTRSDTPTLFTCKVSGDDTGLGIHRGVDNCPYHPFGEPHKLYMNGQEIYKFAVSSVPDRIEELLRRANVPAEEVSYFFLHQANMRILDSAVRRLGVLPEKIPHNIEDVGNTSSASIPLLLDRENRLGHLHAGERLVLCAFGAGLASAACLLTW